ncbi:L,D-transpeptidase family protein [Streptomyces formicae]|uniref:L,D-transpeptidase family protein n=1 Tax=Streptomyces formicae TaxID=1616117 RepID=A0ABY3WJM7_9ACTN|nr:Ig-like domain-containing protein [Streptomyces formicae]UNM12799.1 L,D-transpeptidase family protein [Streptomyces formicae]
MSLECPARAVRALAAIAVPIAVFAACQFSPATETGSAAPHSAGPGSVGVSITPGDGETDVLPHGTVAVQAGYGRLVSVKVVAQRRGAADVTGTWGSGRHTWRSQRTMTPGTGYAVSVVGRDAGGRTFTARSVFRTRSATRTNKATLTPTAGSQVGVGRPVSIAFDKPVRNKAAVERALSVSTSVPTTGSWGWTRDPLSGIERVDWRPEKFWAEGTKVRVRARLSGIDTGAGRYLLHDAESSFTVGRSRISKVDLAKKMMTVYEQGKPIRVIPVSGGKPAYPTWNGTMVVLERAAMVRMTSQSVNIPEPYDLNVPWAVRLTTSGTFVHAAPWNAGKFGIINASHGCIGMSLADGKWFFDRARPGDVVQVSGSSSPSMRVGNGYGDWNVTYADWRRLSALA